VPPLVEKTGFNEFMPEESGYDELRRFFDYCKDTGIVGPKICGQEDNGAVAKPNSVEICVMDASTTPRACSGTTAPRSASSSTRAC
jgi:hypothetical protein